MDGGRVLRALLARRHDRLEATLMAARVARFVALAMILAGFWVDVWLMLIGAFVLMGARSEEVMARRSAAGRTAPPAPRP